MRIGADLAARPAAAGAVRVARALLADADRAAARLAARADPEALHDFRVELRRLRTVLRAFRPALGGAVKRRHLRRLGALARATGEARDAEVQLAWLEGERPRLGARERDGAEWLARRLARRARAGAGGGGGALEEVLAEHRALRAKLRARLGRAERGGERDVALGPALAALLRPQRIAFVERAAAIPDARDVEAAHEARIEGKRLRYLLEPLRGTRGADARAAVTRLRALQDLLGELHDAHVVEGLLRRLRERVAPRRRAGLARLARLAAGRRDARFEALLAARRAGELEALGREVEAVASGLERRRRRPRAGPSGRAPKPLRRGAASTMMRAPRGAPDPERR
jgi:CHAD domain-containing protein